MNHLSRPIRALLALGGAMLVSCLATPDADSAACLEDDACGPCGRCESGACRYDEQAAARPTCVDETEDPCNGVDDDGNGVVDDPDSCWAPVFEWRSAGGASCWSPSPLAPPASCPGYALVLAEPAFALPVSASNGTAALVQCSRGEDHALVVDERVDGVPFEALSAVALWEAAGYACAAPLGRVWRSAPDLMGGTTPFGPACAVSRGFDVSAAELPSGGDHRYLLGGAPVPSGGACDRGSALWVASADPACVATPPPECGAVECPPAVCAEVSSNLDEQTPIPPGYFTVTWTIENCGASRWPPGYWEIAETSVSNHFQTELCRDGLRPGETCVVGAGFTAPAYGVDLAQRFRLRDEDTDATQVEVSFVFDVESAITASLAARSPALEEGFYAGAAVPLSFELAVALDGEPADVALCEELRLVAQQSVLMGGAETALVGVATPEGRCRFESPGATAPDAPGRYVDRWRLLTSDDRTVPVDGAARVEAAVRVIRQVSGTVELTQPPAGTRLAPGQPFLASFVLRNTGPSWHGEWRLEKVYGALSAVSVIPLDEGGVWRSEREVVSVPMRVPSDAAVGSVWREGWNLVDRYGQVVGLHTRQPDGTLSYASDDGAWLVVEVVAGEPCQPASQ